MNYNNLLIKTIFLCVLYFSVLYKALGEIKEKTTSNDEPTVVVQKQVELSSLEEAELIRIFTRKKLFWGDGQKISVFIKPQNSLEHKIFTINILHLSPYKYKSLTDSIVYSGSNNPPTEVESDEKMISLVSRTPNSIGYTNYSIIVNSNDLIIPVEIQK